MFHSMFRSGLFTFLIGRFTATIPERISSFISKAIKSYINRIFPLRNEISSRVWCKHPQIVWLPSYLKYAQLFH